MSTQISGEVFQDALRALSDGNAPPFPQLRMGVPVWASKWDLLALQGRMFNLKETTLGTPLSGGTADAGGIVLTVPWVRFTVPSGTTVFPRRLNLAASAAAGTINEIALAYTQTDSFTSSAGVALTPLNWRTDNPRSSAVTNCYVGASGSVNTEAALVGVRVLYQNAVPTAFGANQTDQLCIDKLFEDLIPIVGPASVLLYFTGATTTPAGYFTLDWAEVPTVSAITAV
jgi:hypothetical protein